jgi:hypothetical protein
VSPSSSLPSGKYVVLAGEAVGGFFAQWFAPILRNKSGQSARLGDVLVLTSKPCGGLMAGVLPESPPTPEIRDFAKSVLKAIVSALELGLAGCAADYVRQRREALRRSA